MALPPLVEPAAELTKDEVARYSRHLIIPDVGMTGQKRLKNAKVLVVGAGGLGSPALLYLAAAGVGTLGIVDFDEVDESNLQRQVIHGQSDIGRPKAESARDSIREVNPFVEVRLHPVRLDSSNVLDIFRDYDLILDGTDNFATRYLVNDAAVLLGKPYVWGSIFRFEGQASVFWEDAPNGLGLNYRDLYPEPPPPGMVPSCAEGGVLGVLCASIGSIMVNEAIKLITGIGEPLLGRLMVYDALEMSYRTIRIRKDPAAAADHRADRLRRVLRGGVRRRAGRRGRAHHHRARAQGDVRRGQGLRADRRPRAARVRDRQHPGRGADPEGPDPVRRGARRDPAGQADGAALQVRRPLGGRARRAAQGRVPRRRARRRRGARVGQAGGPRRCPPTDRAAPTGPARPWGTPACRVAAPAPSRSAGPPAATRDRPPVAAAGHPAGLSFRRTSARRSGWPRSSRSRWCGRDVGPDCGDLLDRPVSDNVSPPGPPACSTVCGWRACAGLPDPLLGRRWVVARVGRHHFVAGTLEPRYDEVVESGPGGRGPTGRAAAWRLNWRATTCYALGGRRVRRARGRAGPATGHAVRPVRR